MSSLVTGISLTQDHFHLFQRVVSGVREMLYDLEALLLLILNTWMAFPASLQTHPVIVSPCRSFALCYSLCTPSPLERASAYAMLLSQARELRPNLHFGSVSLPNTNLTFPCDWWIFLIGYIDNNSNSVYLKSSYPPSSSPILFLIFIQGHPIQIPSSL